MVLRKEIELVHASTNDQLANSLTKTVSKKQLSNTFSKQGIVNIGAPAREEY